MDSGRAEMGVPNRQGGHHSSFLSAGLQPVDPFTSSIAQVTHNRQYPSRIENIDDVYLPPHRRIGFPHIHRPTPYGPHSLPQSFPGTGPRPKPRRAHSRPPMALAAFAAQHAVRSDDHSPYVPTPAPERRSNISVHPLGQPTIHCRPHSRTHSHYDPVPDPVRRHDAAVESPLSSPPSGRGTRESSYHNSRHDSFDHATPPSPVDNAGPPIRPHISSSPVPSSDSSNHPERLLPSQVPLSESLPQQPSPISEHSVPWPAHPAPSLSTIASYRSSEHSHSSGSVIDFKKDSIPSPWSPQYAVYEDRPAASVAVTVEEIIGSGKLFVTDILPRQLYLHCLFRLPYFYFSRVSRVFTETGLTLEEIHEMALEVYTENNLRSDTEPFSTNAYGNSGTKLSPAYDRLRTGWELFIDTLIKEWKTLNIVSVLLLSTIMTTFQIHGAAEDPLTRYLAFWSLICALTSLLYSCSFIIQFSSMHKTYKAVQWAIEVQKMHTILWNVWVMLAMPMVWMVWSILTFIASMMSFMWRARANLPSDFDFSVTRSTESGFRIFICVVLGLGVVYGILILVTFWRYGSRMDEKWTRHVRNIVESHEKDYPSTTLPMVSQGLFGSKSTASSPPTLPTPWYTDWHRPSRRTAASVPPPRPPVVVDYAEHDVEQVDNAPWRYPIVVPSPPLLYPPPGSGETSRSSNSSLSYRSELGIRPRAGTQLVRATQGMPLRRSLPTPPLPCLSISNTSNQPKDADTSLPLELPGMHLYRSASTSSRYPSSRHPILSENSNPNVSKSSERQLHHSASDNLNRYSLTGQSMTVVRDPNNDTGSPTRPAYDFVTSNRPVSATRHNQEVDMYPHSTHRSRSAVSSDKVFEVVRSREMQVEAGPVDWDWAASPN